MLPGIVHLSAFTLAAALFTSSLPAQDRIADLRARFDKEPSAVNKAKTMPQLGDLEFGVIDKDVAERHLPEALAILQTYRDQVETCNKGLDATGVDGAKHPAGFKQLEISLREALRRLESLIATMTGDEQAPFLDVRKELSDVNQHLIQHLFPAEAPSSPAPAPGPPKQDP
jgi:hypothetical protein